ncbi:hypothetical protein COLINT_02999 [Collinsella intestinalis DSM 13280]|uniref:Uncharacterized protein n=1 Tax=Collinsella intestinalis DSM 13280 TaxID=521003 RepID=C4FAA7_9ACTN|nr:hypothetical protein COLINT_02999 [Collinsella intestinalis DSM 13280]
MRSFRRVLHIIPLGKVARRSFGCQWEISEIIQRRACLASARSTTTDASLVSVSSCSILTVVPTGSWRRPAERKPVGSTGHLSGGLIRHNRFGPAVAPHRPAPLRPAT